MEVAVHIIVKGMVQGVGFRYYTIRKAVELNLTGWVKNLYNGNVEVEAEGERSLIEEFIKDLRTGPPMSSVRDLKIEWLNFENKYTKFDVKY